MKKQFLQLSYSSMPAAPPVADLVDGLWKIENPSDTPQQFTVLPDGFFKVLLTSQLGQTPQFILSGVHTQAFSIAVAAHATIVGIRFRLLAAEHLFPHPLPLDAATPLPPEGWLYEALLSAPSLDELAQQLEVSLAPLQPEPRKRTLFTLLYKETGSLSVAELATAANWPARQINRYFQAHFGLSLKAYSNVLRSYAAARQLRPDDLFATGSYYDQSHGIRELKKHTGASPRQLNQHRHDRFIQLCPPQDPELCPP